MYYLNYKMKYAFFWFKKIVLIKAYNLNNFIYF